MRDNGTMICALTGEAHRLFFMRSAWWCADCKQKIESCCDGGGCPSIIQLYERESAERPEGREAGARSTFPTSGTRVVAPKIPPSG